MITPNNLKPFQYFCTTIGEIPSSYLESMTYYETLIWLCNYLENTVIPAVNNNANALTELQTLFTQLQNYVNNYFNNLDVQTEINNKLDDMAKDGTLSQIIDLYIQSNTLMTFNNVEEMSSTTKLQNNSNAHTLGYYTINDGGESTYKIRTKTDADIVDNATIIALQNNLIAELITNNSINPSQFGCYGDGIHDDTENLQKCINYALNNNINLIIEKDYLVNPSLQSDNTYVALKITRPTTISSRPFIITFKGGSKIFTNSVEESTLIRMNCSNTIIYNMYLTGTNNKTILLQMSRINLNDTTETLYNNRNSFINTKLSNGLTGIEMQGGAYYNSFTKTTINDVSNGIIMKQTHLEDIGVQTDPSVNRNEFINTTLLNITANGLQIKYGDTNKFVNFSTEGVNNPIYVDDPQLHTSDFPITPQYYPYDNMFVNITNEAATGIPFYNNCRGTKIINSSIKYNTTNFPQIPQVMIAGVTNDQSVQIYGNTADQSIQNKLYNSSVPQSTINTSVNGINAKTFYDYIINNSDITPLTKTNAEFSTNATSNITTMNYETNDKVLFKSIGGILFIAGKVRVTVSDTSKSFSLLFPTDLTWARGNTSLNNFSSLPPIKLPVIVTIGEIDTICIATIYQNRIEITNPNGNWNNGGYNIVYFSNYIYRDRNLF